MCGDILISWRLRESSNKESNEQEGKAIISCPQLPRPWRDVLWHLSRYEPALLLNLTRFNPFGLLLPCVLHRALLVLTTTNQQEASATSHNQLYPPKTVNNHPSPLTITNDQQRTTATYNEQQPPTTINCPPPLRPPATIWNHLKHKITSKTTTTQNNQHPGPLI